MKPQLEAFANDMGAKAKVVEVDIQKDPDLASKYNVMSIPAFVVIRNGDVVAQSAGVQNAKQLAELVAKAS